MNDTRSSPHKVGYKKVVANWSNNQDGQASPIQSKMFRLLSCFVALAVFGLLCSTGESISTLIPDDVISCTEDTDSHETDSFIETSGLIQDINLSEYIWQNSLHLLPQAWKTTFIAGVANGTMDPNFYADYTLQDAIYCRLLAQLWTQLANNASVDADIRKYANDSISGFQSCSIELFDRWNVKDDRGDGYGIYVREPVTDYVTFVNDTMLAYPPNMLIATYGCLKLWHNLTGDLWTMLQNSTSNPYRVWVVENHGSGSAHRQAAQMDEWDQNNKWYNRSEALSLFHTALLKEINFFDHGGNSTSWQTLTET